MRNEDTNYHYLILYVTLNIVLREYGNKSSYFCIPKSFVPVGFIWMLICYGNRIRAIVKTDAFVLQFLKIHVILFLSVEMECKTIFVQTLASHLFSCNRITQTLETALALSVIRMGTAGTTGSDITQYSPYFATVHLNLTIYFLLGPL